MDIPPNLHIPDEELVLTFARSGGPGGQNVNKVASKAILHWDLAANTSLSEDVKARLRVQQAGRLTTEGVLVLQCQRFRDQPKNIEDCYAKVRDMVLQALRPPTPRRATRPTRASKRRRVEAKRKQSQRKAGRRRPTEE
jgi:ribosome-associated protein